MINQKKTKNIFPGYHHLVALLVLGGNEQSKNVSAVPSLSLFLLNFSPFSSRKRSSPADAVGKPSTGAKLQAVKPS